MTIARTPLTLLTCVMALAVGPRFGRADNPATQPTTAPSVPGLHEITVDGRQRSYLVHVPPSYDKSKPTPLVIVFHGAMMNGASMEKFSQLSSKSDAAGFIAVYPNGMGPGTEHLVFNSNFPVADGKRVDDVAFTSKLIDDVEHNFNIDARRVFATGISNGGMMCYRLADELSDRIAAIAPVSGTMVLPDPKPKRPVPIIHFHGTADKLVAFDGPKRAKLLPTNYKSVDQTMSTWCGLDGCPVEPKIEQLPDTAHDGTSITRKTFGPGKDDSEIVLYVIDGGGHNWPGRGGALPLIGVSTKNIDANDLLWAFFQRHPMK